jgi:hypothetical protein
MLALDILTVGQQAGLVTPGTNAWAGSKAAVPSDGDGPFTVVTDYGGLAPDYCHSLPQPWQNKPASQVTVRAATADAAFALAQQLYSAICLVTNRIVNGTYYLAMRPKQPPFDMGLDATGSRVTVGFNVQGFARG